MNEGWIKEMQEKMAGYEHPAPELPWDEVDRVLSANKSRRARRILLKRLAVAAILLLVAGVGYWGFLHKETQQSPSITASVEKQENHGPVPMILEKMNPQHALVAMSEPEAVTPGSTAGADTITSPAESWGQVHDSVQNQATCPHDSAHDFSKPSESPRHVIYPSDLRERKHSNNRLTAQVYMSSTMVGNQMFSTQVTHNEIKFVGITDSTHPKLAEQQIRHRQPVRFGLSLRYRLDDRWSIESGLSYARLSSDITTTVNDVTTVTEQRLNYIGLPLNVSYDLWKSHNFGLYVTAGGTIEKSLNTNPWQFSLNGGAGAEYKLTDFFSLYAEPGLGYYFKDGSSTPTIYKDHPLNFNLNFGLRFNLK